MVVVYYCLYGQKLATDGINLHIYFRGGPGLLFGTFYILAPFLYTKAYSVQYNGGTYRLS